MAIYVFLGLVLLCALLLALLQLPLGTLLLLYHSVLGRGLVRSRCRSLVSSYIAGVVTMSFVLLAATCFLVPIFSAIGLPSQTLRFSLFLILIGLSVFVLCFYYRRNRLFSPRTVRSTELWLPRSVARYLNTRAKSTKSFPEAFSLGAITILSELPFSFPLFFLSAFGILGLNPLCQVFSLALFAIFSALPLVILRLAVRSGKNLADIQRWRLKNRTFFRFLSGIGYFILACFFFAFFILGNGGFNV